jgi:hypothetical protein
VRLQRTSKMKTSEYSVWKSSELAMDNVIRFVMENYRNEDGTTIDAQELTSRLIFLVQATALDVSNANGNFLRRYTDALMNELNDKKL